VRGPGGGVSHTSGEFVPLRIKKGESSMTGLFLGRGKNEGKVDLTPIFKKKREEEEYSYCSSMTKAPELKSRGLLSHWRTGKLE